MNKLSSGILLILACLSPWATAQIEPKAPSISELSGTDGSFLQQQRERVDRLTREQLGTPIRGNKTDLNALQRIIDRDLVAQDDKLMQQALGVILADVMLTGEPALAWKIYEDRRGRSRALCVTGIQECLFPVTMLSRRMAVGLKPDVKKIYVEAMTLMGEQLPELPYGAERKYTPY